MNNIREIIEYLLPDAQFSISNDDAKTIIWNDKRRKPDAIEMAAVQPAVSQAIEAKKVDKAIETLEKQMHDYLELRYSTNIKLFLLGLYVYPKCSTEKRMKIEELWSWMEGVVSYYFTLKTKIKKGQTVTEEECDFSKLFDSTDPLLTIESLPE